MQWQIVMMPLLLGDRLGIDLGQPSFSDCWISGSGTRMTSLYCAIGFCRRLPKTGRRRRKRCGDVDVDTVSIGLPVRSGDFKEILTGVLSCHIVNTQAEVKPSQVVRPQLAVCRYCLLVTVPRGRFCCWWGWWMVRRWRRKYRLIVVSTLPIAAMLRVFC